MRKNKAKREIALILAMILSGMIFLSGIMSITAFAASGTQLTYTVTYGQTEARSMLASINAWRTGSDAWYWNSDNATKTTLSGAAQLEYDYGLERIAMKRAAELAISFSHSSGWYQLFFCI